MKKYNEFENKLRTGGFKRICNKNHKIIENKYIEIFGIEDYTKKKDETQKSLYNHYKILNNVAQKNGNIKFKTLEQFESEPDYLHILPYIRTQLFYHFKNQGIEINDIEQFLKLCQE